MSHAEHVQAIALAAMLVVAYVGWWWLLDPNPLPARHVRHEAAPPRRTAAAVAVAVALVGRRPSMRRDPLAPRVLERATAAGRHATIAPRADLAPLAIRGGHSYRIQVAKPLTTPKRQPGTHRAAPGTRARGRKK